MNRETVNKIGRHPEGCVTGARNTWVEETSWG